MSQRKVEQTEVITFSMHGTLSASSMPVKNKKKIGTIVGCTGLDMHATLSVLLSLSHSLSLLLFLSPLSLSLSLNVCGGTFNAW